MVVHQAVPAVGMGWLQRSAMRATFACTVSINRRVLVAHAEVEVAASSCRWADFPSSTAGGQYALMMRVGCCVFTRWVLCIMRYFAATSGMYVVPVAAGICNGYG